MKEDPVYTEIKVDSNGQIDLAFSRPVNFPSYMIDQIMILKDSSRRLLEFGNA